MVSALPSAAFHHPGCPLQGSSGLPHPASPHPSYRRGPLPRHPGSLGEAQDKQIFPDVAVVEEGSEGKGGCCRERAGVLQVLGEREELLNTAKRFRKEQIPLDLIVQDWQYWGKYGWNAMRFDEEHYPDPAQMVKDLHDMDMKLMISVWSKIDPSSEVGKAAQEKGLFIPGTTWIDFFDEDASSFYWNNFRNRLLKHHSSKVSILWHSGFFMTHLSHLYMTTGKP